MEPIKTITSEEFFTQLQKTNHSLVSDKHSSDFSSICDIVNYIMQEKKSFAFFQRLDLEYLYCKEIILSIVSNLGTAIKHLPVKFQDDKDVALLAVLNQASSLQFFSKRLRNDPEVVLNALKSEGAYYFKMAEEELKNNKKQVLFFISKGYDIFPYLKKPFKEDLLKELKNFKKNLQRINPNIQEFQYSLTAKLLLEQKLIDEEKQKILNIPKIEEKLSCNDEIFKRLKL